MTWKSEAMIKFKSNKFSEFAELGDLSKYSLVEISALVKNLKKEERVVGQINYVTWSNDYYVFIFEYDLKGCFRRISSEVWKNPKEDIISRLRNYIK